MMEHAKVTSCPARKRGSRGWTQATSSWVWIPEVKSLGSARGDYWKGYLGRSFLAETAAG